MVEFERLRCPVCGSPDIVEKDGNLVCESCGYVLDENMISNDFEIRFFEAEDFHVKSRAPRPREDYDIEVPSIRIRTANKKEKYSIPISYRERTIKVMLNHLDELSVRLNLPDSAKSEARKLIKEFVIKKQQRVKNLRNITAAIVFLALRITGNPRPLDVFIKLALSHENAIKSKREFNKALMTVKRILKLNYVVNRDDVRKLIIYMARELNLSGKCLIFALKTYEQIKNHKRFIATDPSSLAAAVIYIATKALGEERSPGDIAKLASITKTTLRNKGREVEVVLGNIHSK